MNDQHNHDLFTEVELAQMPQNRFIPEKVKIKMSELNELGVLKSSQIKTLVEQEHFRDVPVTWTVRDVQNLLQKASNRAHKTIEFVKLLKEKSNDGWSFNFQLNDDTLRLERVFWISASGKDKYRHFNDVFNRCYIQDEPFCHASSPVHSDRQPWFNGNDWWFFAFQRTIWIILLGSSRILNLYEC